VEAKGRKRAISCEWVIEAAPPLCAALTGLLSHPVLAVSLIGVESRTKWHGIAIYSAVRSMSQSRFHSSPILHSDELQQARSSVERA
jgi:hypothetical protein